MGKKRSIEDLVDEMITFTSTAGGGGVDAYVDICEQSVAEAKEHWENEGTADDKIIYEDSLEFLRFAKIRQDESN